MKLGASSAQYSHNERKAEEYPSKISDWTRVNL